MRRDSKLSRLFRPALLGAVVLLSAPAEGSLVRYDFRGRVTEENLGGPSALGREFTGTLIYDDAILLGPSRDDPWGRVERPYASGVHRPDAPAPDGTMLQLWIDGRAVAPESAGLSGGLFSGAGGSELIFHSHVRDRDGSPQPGGISIRFQVDPALLASGKLPDGLTVADLPQASVGVQGALDGRFWDELSGGFNYGGPVETFAIAPVPEPAWTVAALLAAAAWAARRRGRR